MNKDIAAGEWEQLKGSMKRIWGELTDHDITPVTGNTQELAGIIREKYGRTKEEAENQTDDFVVNRMK